MKRRIQALAVAAGAMGILSLLAQAPEPPRPAVLGEQAEATAPARPGAGPLGRAEALPAGTAERR